MRALGATDLQKEALQVCSLVIKAFSDYSKAEENDNFHKTLIKIV